MSPQKVTEIAASLRSVGGAYEYVAAVFAHQNGGQS